MYDDVERRQQICEVLDKNNVVYDTRFKKPAPLATDSSFFNLAILALYQLCFYGINNGFTVISKEAGEIVDYALQLCNYKDRHNRCKSEDACIKAINKVLKKLEKKVGLEVAADHSVYFVQQVSLGIEKEMTNYIQETIDYTNVIFKEIMSCDEEAFGYSLRLSGITEFDKTVSEWQNDSKKIMDEAMVLLNAVKDKMKLVWDGSSQKARGYAEQLLNAMKLWRNHIVYSYLFLDESMLDCLKNAVRTAEAWHNDLLGVVDNGAQRIDIDAETALFNKYRKDQLNYYVNNLRKSA